MKTRLKELRTQAGLSLSALSQETGMLRQSLSQWETDFVEPNLSTVKKLAQFYGVSLDYLLDYTEDYVEPQFNTRLRELRESCSLTLNQAGGSLGISGDRLRKYETDNREAGYEMLIKLADYYGVSIDYLLKHDIEKGRTDDQNTTTSNSGLDHQSTNETPENL